MTNAMIEKIVIEVGVVDISFSKYKIEKSTEVLSNLFLKYIIEM